MSKRHTSLFNYNKYSNLNDKQIYGYSKNQIQGFFPA